MIPNFAMTDYASQGKTRKQNIVDLNNSHSHQAYYTTLSQSSTADGTLILQGFDEKKITGGASGALRQEFRVLELLDYITLLRYHSKLPLQVSSGSTRYDLIRTFQSWKGKNWMPPQMHKSIKWNNANQFIEEYHNFTGFVMNLNQSMSRKNTVTTHENVTTTNQTLKRKSSIPDTNTEIIQASKHKKIKLMILNPSLKRKRADNDFLVQSKKPKTVNWDISHAADLHTYPVGLQWKENSCAYDAILTIFYNIWKEDPNLRSEQFKSSNLGRCYQLHERFMDVLHQQSNLHVIQENLRHMLHSYSSEFPYANKCSYFITSFS